LDNPTLENEVLKFLCNIRNHLPIETASHLRRTESSNQTHKLILQAITSLNYECLSDNFLINGSVTNIQPPAVPFRFAEK